MDDSHGGPVWDVPFDFERARAAGFEGNETEAHIQLGLYLQEQGRAPEALATLRRAMVLAPEQGRAAYHLGCLLLERGAYEEAVEALRWSAVRTPDHWVTHHKLGQALVRSGSYEPAVLAFTAAVILNPRAPAPWIERAQAYETLGLVGLARRDVEAALQLEPRSGKFLRLRERLEQLSGPHTPEPS